MGGNCIDCRHCHWCLQKLFLCYFSDCLVFVILLASPPPLWCCENCITTATNLWLLLFFYVDVDREEKI